jgi:hypothetical protein
VDVRVAQPTRPAHAHAQRQVLLPDRSAQPWRMRQVITLTAARRTWFGDVV